MFNKLFGRRKSNELKIDEEQIAIATDVIFKRYEIYEQGMLKVLMDSCIELKKEVLELKDRVNKLEKQNKM